MDINESLQIIIDNIERQEFKLLNINFNANEQLSGIFDEQFIHTELKIPLKQIGRGEAVIKQKDETVPIIFAIYEFDLKYSIKNNKDKQEIISLNVKYKINLFLKDSIENIIKQEKDEIGEILNIFFDNTGRIMIYPYFRNLADILARESGFILPSLPPLKINN